MPRNCQGTIPVAAIPRFCRLDPMAHFPPTPHMSTRILSHPTTWTLATPPHAQPHKWQAYIDLPTDIVYFRKHDIFEVYETFPPTLHYEYTCTTVYSPPIQFLLTSASPDTRFSDQEPHHTSRLPQHQLTEFRQPLKMQSHLEMPGILVQLGHIQCT